MSIEAATDTDDLELIAQHVTLFRARVGPQVVRLSFGEAYEKHVAWHHAIVMSRADAEQLRDMLFQLLTPIEKPN